MWLSLQKGYIWSRSLTTRCSVKEAILSGLAQSHCCRQLQRLNASPTKRSHYGEKKWSTCWRIVITQRTSSTRRVPRQVTPEQKERCLDTSQNFHSKTKCSMMTYCSKCDSWTEGKIHGHKQNLHNKTKWSMTTCWSTQHLQTNARLTTFSLKERGPTNRNKKRSICAISDSAGILGSSRTTCRVLYFQRDHRSLCNIIMDHLKHDIRSKTLLTGQNWCHVMAWQC